jgi:hypothetical protein
MRAMRRNLSAVAIGANPTPSTRMAGGSGCGRT